MNSQEQGWMVQSLSYRHLGTEPYSHLRLGQFHSHKSRAV